MFRRHPKHPSTFRRRRVHGHCRAPTAMPHFGPANEQVRKQLHCESILLFQVRLQPTVVVIRLRSLRSRAGLQPFAFSRIHCGAARSRWHIARRARTESACEPTNDDFQNRPIQLKHEVCAIRHGLRRRHWLLKLLTRCDRTVWRLRCAHLQKLLRHLPIRGFQVQDVPSPIQLRKARP